jgi:hypothetical protein
VKIVGKIKHAFPDTDKIRVVTYHAAKVIRDLGRYAAVDVPAQAAAAERKNRKIKVGTAKVGTAKVGSAKVGTAKVGPAKVGTAKVGTAKVGTAKVGSAKVGLSPSLIAEP